MTKYFYYNGQSKEGPLTLEELKQINIESNTLIWHAGLDDWKEAGSIDELKDGLELGPSSLGERKDNRTFVASKELRFSQNPTNTNFEVTVKQKMFSNTFSYYGRIRRTEYGISLIIYFFFSFFASILVGIGGAQGFAIIYIPILWFITAQGAKRSHDIGNSGWLQLIPFYVLWLLFAKGEFGINKYGANPKGMIF